MEVYCQHAQTCILQAWQGAIYVIWQELNRRCHNGITMPSDKTFKLLGSLLINKITALVNLRRSTGLARAPNIVQENHVRIATLAVIQDLLKDNIDPRPTCTEVGTMMSSRSKAWLVAATIGAVEASKDQLGLCRWNYMIRSVNQRIRNNVRSATQANRFSSSSTTVVASGKDGDTAKKAEESLRTVMYLSCWGPN
ncbi:hypothetical protein Bca101_097100 [Brassica carinata]